MSARNFFASSRADGEVVRVRLHRLRSSDIDVVILPQDVRREDRLSGLGVYANLAASEMIGERFITSGCEIVLRFD